MSTSLAAALLCGVGLGVGLWTLVALMPRVGRPRLTERIAPYILDVSAEAREIVSRRTVHPIPVLGRLIEPVLERARTILTSLVGGSETTARRLRQAGSTVTVEQFRTEQLVWGAIGLTVGGVAAVLLPTLASLPAPARVAIPVTAAIAGILSRDWVLQRAARKRLSRIASELPTVLEFVALSLSAGEGILDAIRRVARTGSGELASEFGIVAGDVSAGVPVSTALTALGERLHLPALGRCLDQIVGALDRGTPLAEVLHAQAGDVRAEAKRKLIELAGRKEVAMLIPLVFLILPTTIAFALFPGVFVLQAGF